MCTGGSIFDLHTMVLLRQLVPFRRLDYHEALFLAEQQASILLKLSCLFEPPVPIERLTIEHGLAKEIRTDPEQAELGKSNLDTSGEWIITLNLKNQLADRAFVIAHEVKHILDYGFGDTLYPPVDVMTPSERKEHMANFFAMSLLAPRQWVEQCWKRGMRSVEVLAAHFDVPAAYMGLRLEALRYLSEGER